MGISVGPSVAIIGAGWAGLSAAVRLTDAGARVTLYESARQVGGRARSVEWQDNQVDNGQHLLVGAYSATLGLMHSVGVDPGRVLRRMPLNIDAPGRLAMRLPAWPAPLHLAFGLLGARGATLGEKWSAAVFMRKLQASHYRLAADLPVAEWLDNNRQQGTLRQHLWNPLCLAALNTHPEDASAQVFANVLRDTLGGHRAATDMLLPALDLGRILPEPALGYLKEKAACCKLSTRVEAIEPACISENANAWQVITRDGSAHFDHAVIAAAPHHVNRLLPDAPALNETRFLIEQLAEEPIATVYLQYPAPVRLRQVLMALNHKSTQWLADRGQLGGPPGLLAHVLSAHGAWENLDNDALADALHRDTNQVFREFSVMPSLPDPISRLVIREQRATFRCTPNLTRPGVATALPGLWLAGDYTSSDYPGTLEGAVRSGEAVAAGILRRFSAKASEQAG